MVYWPTESKPVPLEDLGWINTAYLAASTSRGDPTIVWGTTVQMEALTQFISDQRRETGTLISVAHLLIRSVVEALYRHPAFNRKVIGRRIYPYNGIHVTMPILETRFGEANILHLRHVERMPLIEISRTIWEKARDVAVRVASEQCRQKAGGTQDNRRRWLRWIRIQWIHKMARVGFFLTNRFRIPTIYLHEINGTSAFVNHLGFAGAPPMISFKPSCLPTNSFGVSVTLGPAEMRPVVEGEQIVPRSVAPLFVRADHRLVNGYQTAEFVRTVREMLHSPSQLIAAANAPRDKAA